MTFRQKAFSAFLAGALTSLVIVAIADRVGATPDNVQRIEAVELLVDKAGFDQLYGTHWLLWDDTRSLSAGEKGALKAAAHRGGAPIVYGFPDDTFRPREPVTFGQWASMLTRAYWCEPLRPSHVEAFTNVVTYFSSPLVAEWIIELLDEPIPRKWLAQSLDDVHSVRFSNSAVEIRNNCPGSGDGGRGRTHRDTGGGGGSGGGGGGGPATGDTPATGTPSTGLPPSQEPFDESAPCYEWGSHSHDNPLSDDPEEDAAYPLRVLDVDGNELAHRHTGTGIDAWWYQLLSIDEDGYSVYSGPQDMACDGDHAHE